MMRSFVSNQLFHIPKSRGKKIKITIEIEDQQPEKPHVPLWPPTKPPIPPKPNWRDDYRVIM